MPINIPKEIQEFIKGKVAWVASADQNGQPNLAPKGTLQIIDDQTLAFANLFSFKTTAALKHNPKIAVAVIDAASPSGYQFKGSTELISAGSLFDQLVEGVKKALPGLPAPKDIVKITVEEIYSLTPGPDAGKKIA